MSSLSKAIQSAFEFLFHNFLIFAITPSLLILNDLILGSLYDDIILSELSVE